ncbi:glycosyltransferase [Metabacillus niabensis]|uniref:glycosyltransferase n=1 Tax=Metabacillus niabensis TaxID=324854 RepID=UPI0039A0EC29
MISVILPVYNAEKYIEQSIDSILKQTEQNFELIIINDGSTDKSEEVIFSFSDSRIKYIYQNNSGAASARNRGLEEATGSFIVFQDADDISLPHRFEMLKRQFTAPNIGVVHSDMLIINEINTPIGYLQSRSMERNRVLRFFLKVGTFVNGPSMMIRREVFKNNLRYDTSLKIGEDTNLILEVLQNWNSVHVPEPLYFYRRHSTNTTNESDYKTIVLHVQRTIEQNSIKKLFPELNWEKNSENENKSYGFALLALILFRRDFREDSLYWYNKALQISNDRYTEKFVFAIGEIINGKLDKALEYLYTIKPRDHIIENYIGEVLALLGYKDLSFFHFVQSLKMKPDYSEPVDNLRSLGALKSYNLLDTTWLKFKVNK